MGLKISSMMLQRLIDRVLRGAHSFASSLIDDIVCYSITFEEHVSLTLTRSNHTVEKRRADCQYG